MVEFNSFHRVYMTETELKVNMGSVQVGNSTRVEISTQVGIIANSHVHAQFFNSGRVEIKALHCRIFDIALWGNPRPHMVPFCKMGSEEGTCLGMRKMQVYPFIIQLNTWIYPSDYLLR